MRKYFSDQPLTTHDKINFRTIYKDPAYCNRNVLYKKP